MDSTILRIKHLWMPGFGFPGLKGRTHLSLFFLFDFLATRWSTIIPERWNGTVFACRFGLLSQVSFNNSFVIDNDYRSDLFLYPTTLSLGKQSN